MNINFILVPTEPCPAYGTEVSINLNCIAHVTLQPADRHRDRPAYIHIELNFNGMGSAINTTLPNWAAWTTLLAEHQ